MAHVLIFKVVTIVRSINQVRSPLAVSYITCIMHTSLRPDRSEPAEERA